MSAQLDHDSVALGACFAIVHAQDLLCDAAILYERRRASTALHLAVMAREELGRFVLLSRQYRELPSGAFISARDLVQLLQPHKTKLQAGQYTVPVPMPPELLKEWQLAIQTNDEPKASAISSELRARAAKIKPHQAAEWHQRRLRAQYVDLDQRSGTWSQPSETSMQDAETLIRTVMAEIANDMLACQGVPWIHDAFSRSGLPFPRVGPFTHQIYAALGAVDA